MAHHLITIPYGTVLPSPAGLPEGYPFRLDPAGDLYTIKAGVFALTGGGGGGGGGGAVGVGDFALWKRTGVQDATSNTFNYAVDLSSSGGTSIAVDSSGPWITAWGSAAPVLVAGVYAFTLSQSKAAAFRTSLQLIDATGTTLAWSPSAFGAGDFLEMVGASSSGSFVAHDSITVYVPATTHVDLGVAIGADATAQTNLLIQKVG